MPDPACPVPISAKSKIGNLAFGFVCDHGMGQRMPPKFGTPDYWLERAEEARAMALDMSDPEAKKAMLGIAENYEKIAKRAEAREAGLNLTKD